MMDRGGSHSRLHITGTRTAEGIMRVAELMTTAVVSCGPQDTLARAAQMMWDRDIGCVAVADEARRVIGMITDRDICMAALIQGRALDAIAVDTAMAHH